MNGGSTDTHAREVFPQRQQPRGCWCARAPARPMRVRAYGVNFCAKAKPLLTNGSARWEFRFAIGPSPVTIAWARADARQQICARS